MSDLPERAELAYVALRPLPEPDPWRARTKFFSFDHLCFQFYMTKTLERDEKNIDSSLSYFLAHQFADDGFKANLNSQLSLFLPLCILAVLLHRELSSAVLLDLAAEKRVKAVFIFSLFL